MNAKTRYLAGYPVIVRIPWTPAGSLMTCINETRAYAALTIWVEHLAEEADFGRLSRVFLGELEQQTEHTALEGSVGRTASR